MRTILTSTTFPVLFLTSKMPTNHLRGRGRDPGLTAAADLYFYGSFSAPEDAQNYAFLRVRSNDSPLLRTGRIALRDDKPDFIRRMFAGGNRIVVFKNRRRNVHVRD